MTLYTEHIEDSQLTAYLDTELAPLEMREVASHIAGCDTCSERLSLLLSGQAAIRSLVSPESNLPPWSAMKVRIDRMPVPRHFTPTRRVASMALLLAVALLSTVVLISRSDLSSSEDLMPIDAQTVSLDLGLYLEDLDHPAVENRFETTYEVIPASYRNALRSTGISRTGPLERVPGEYDVEEVSIVNYEAATPATRILYSGPSGKIVMFCQGINSETGFSGFAKAQIMVRDTSCTSVYCSKYRALSFETEQGTFTIVGSRIGSALDEFLDAILP